MGFNKCYLPSLQEMEQLLEKLGEEKFIKRFHKYDAYIGSEESMNLLQSITDHQTSHSRS